MAKRLAKREKGSHFWLGAGIYAAVALVLIGIGLSCFWDFLSAYEVSRPGHTVDSYMETLNARHILDLAGEDLLAQVDGRLGDGETYKAQVLAALAGKYTCARNISRSTDQTQVYALRLGSQVIGSVQMEQVGQSHWNFTPWAVTGEEFDLSFLLGEKVSVTIPQDYTVLVNGISLPQDCVVEEAIPYPQLAEFAGDYDLPTMVRYEAGPFLGEATVTILDGAGEPVDLETHAEIFLENCDQGEREKVEKAVEAFIKCYVDFTSCAGEGPIAMLEELNKLMVPRGELARRMRGALDGLYWVTDRHASVSALEVSQVSRLAEDLYFCDVTYTVDTRDITGQVQVESHIKLMFRQTGSGLLAEAMVVC